MGNGGERAPHDRGLTEIVNGYFNRIEDRRGYTTIDDAYDLEYNLKKQSKFPLEEIKNTTMEVLKRRGYNWKLL